MRPSRPFVLLAALAGLVVLTGFAPGAAPNPGAGQDLKKLHVLLVFDTDSNLADGLKVDKKNVEALLARNIPQSHYSAKTLDGKNVTKENILSYYKDLKVGPNEGIFFFYGGHGGTLGNKHFLALHSGKFFREELIKAVEAKKPALAVILTDCCSDKVKLNRGEVVDGKGGEDMTVPMPVFRQLFFRARGLVDITAATNDKAYGDDEKGGIFTRAFCRSLEYRSVKDKDKAPAKAVLARLDANKDGALTWQEYFPALRDDTTTLFKSWMDDPDVRGAVGGKTPKPQVPQAFKLGNGPVVNPVAGKGKEYLVVSLINRTEKALNYEYRWSGESGWKEGKMAAGGQACVSRPASGGSQPAVLEIRLKGSENVSKLEPGHWSGNGSPTFKDGRLYNWKPRK